MSYQPDEMEDLTLVCMICDTEFTWLAGEQIFYAERGLSEPRRCFPCRQRRAELREQLGIEKSRTEKEDSAWQTQS